MALLAMTSDSKMKSALQTAAIVYLLADGNCM